MFNNTITYLIAGLTLLLLMLFSVYLLVNSKKKARHVLLSVFFLANALYLVDYLLTPIQNTLGISMQWFDEIGLAFGFLFGPLIFFFIGATITTQFKIQRSMLWHVLPFVFFLIAYVFFEQSVICQYGYMVLFVHLFTYYFVSWFVLKKHRIQIKSFFSSLENGQFNWIKYALIGFILVTVIDLTSAILAFFHWDNPTTRSNLNFFSVVINFLYVVYIFFKSIHIPEHTDTHPEELQALKYSNSKLTHETKQAILQKLEDYFANEKPYLNPSLTISDVSNAIDVHMKSISQVINEFLQKNFYDFTNGYRIQEAKIRLATIEDKKKTILEILYESGFNSKSSFNTAFKKHTQLTPTQFRQQILRSKTV